MDRTGESPRISQLGVQRFSLSNLRMAYFTIASSDLPFASRNICENFRLVLHIEFAKFILDSNFSDRGQEGSRASDHSVIDVLSSLMSKPNSRRHSL